MRNSNSRAGLDHLYEDSPSPPYQLRGRLLPSPSMRPLYNSFPLDGGDELAHGQQSQSTHAPLDSGFRRNDGVVQRLTQ